MLAHPPVWDGPIWQQCGTILGHFMLLGVRVMVTLIVMVRVRVMQMVRVRVRVRGA